MFISYILIIFLLAFDCFLISSDASFVRRSNSGLMKLCPPGGESFTAAWEITCGMKRKKRDVNRIENESANIFTKFAKKNNPTEIERLSTALSADKYRAPSMTEMMLLCCRFGCSLRDLMPYCDPFGQWDS
ncbi:hypothetical protein ACQ4LE_009311 [Meloidogyne hapla]|uniref:IlGF domain-containing protein n=1 Tax=Meloidogyne hapla TaxID=6305 RepID=A0A1I8BMU4_MELHA